jgi:hypothetical protein
MINFLLIFLSFLSLFLGIVYLYFQTKNIKLERKDYIEWLKLQNKIRIYRLNFVKKIYSPFLNFIYHLLLNFFEKILMRIKIESLKLESWAIRKIEKIKEKKKSQESQNKEI